MNPEKLYNTNVINDYNPGSNLKTDWNGKIWAAKFKGFNQAAYLKSQIAAESYDLSEVDGFGVGWI